MKKTMEEKVVEQLVRPITISKISTITGLDKKNVSNIVQSLINSGAVEVVGNLWCVNKFTKEQKNSSRKGKLFQLKKYQDTQIIVNELKKMTGKKIIAEDSIREALIKKFPDRRYGVNEILTVLRLNPETFGLKKKIFYFNSK